jgi:AGCS family alanine or glycine:cation symporter
MWISALVGMATKYFTCTLAILYRGRDSRGEIQGGPMYVIVEGLGPRWRPLASFFCVAGLIGCLPVFNVNQLTQAVRDILLVPAGVEVGFTSNLIVGIVLAVLVGTVIFGGLHRIGSVAGKLVPFMVVVYFVAVVAILIMNLEKVPSYLAMILTNAFTAEHFTGDPLLGGALGGLIVLGARRAAFSNEAGIGTAPMAHGAARTNQPVQEGLVAMLGPAIDTLVVCTLTALAILMTDVWTTSDANGVTLTANAFTESFPVFGGYVLLVCILSFRLSSLFSYSYFGTKCLSFLAGAERARYYNIAYVLSILIGATSSLTLIINLIDLSFALMAIPTVTSAVLLSPSVMKATRAYFSERAYDRV